MKSASAGNKSGYNNGFSFQNKMVVMMMQQKAEHDQACKDREFALPQPKVECNEAKLECEERAQQACEDRLQQQMQQQQLMSVMMMMGLMGGGKRVHEHDSDDNYEHCHKSPRKKLSIK